jgi:hypothetical protein
LYSGIVHFIIVICIDLFLHPVVWLNPLEDLLKANKDEMRTGSDRDDIGNTLIHLYTSTKGDGNGNKSRKLLIEIRRLDYDK